jgi:hypothetical protein
MTIDELKNIVLNQSPPKTRPLRPIEIYFYQTATNEDIDLFLNKLNKSLEMQKLGICDIWETNEAQSEGKFFIDVYKIDAQEKIIKEIENISKGFNFLNPMQVLEIKYNRKRFVWKSYIFGNEQVIINLTDKERDEEDAVELAIPKGIKVLTEEEIAREAKIDKLLSYLVFFLLFVLTIIYFWYYFQP